jgi:hypothetical protein
MKIRFIPLSIGILFLLGTTIQAQQVVDLSTGVTNGTTSLINPGIADDTWQVQLPNLTTQPAYSSTGLPSVWASPSGSCGRWIVPSFSTAAGTYGLPGSEPQGDFLYKMTFVANNCPVTSAVINLNIAGADNLGGPLNVNGTNYPLLLTLSPGGFGNFNPLTTNIVINLSPGDIVPGINTITVKVYNDGLSTFTGLLLCGNLTINYSSIDPGLIPSITGPTNFCSGTYSLVFYGSDGPSTATNHFWEIVEIDAVGVPISGGYSWSKWYPGSPASSFGFPNPTHCNRYYRVKLAVQNACVSWVETTKVIYFGCKYVADAGPDQTICKGDCVTIGTTPGPVKATSFVWSVLNHNGTTTNVGNSKTLKVCPTTTTTYTLLATNTIVGCSTSDSVIVTVKPTGLLDPDFKLTLTTTVLNQEYTISVTTYNPLPAGAGFSWTIEAIDAATGQVLSNSTLSNPSAYWSNPNPGLNGSPPLLLSGYNYPYSINPNGYNPNPGKFYEYSTDGSKLCYRITRGVWLDACNPYVQKSYTVGCGAPPRSKGQ